MPSPPPPDRHSHNFDRVSEKEKRIGLSLKGERGASKWHPSSRGGVVGWSAARSEVNHHQDEAEVAAVLLHDGVRRAHRHPPLCQRLRDDLHSADFEAVQGDTHVRIA